MSFNDIDDIKIKEELQRLSHSLSINNSGGSVEEVSLGTHIINKKIEINDDDIINELTTDNFSHKVNMNEYIQSNSNLNVLINEQIRATNGYINQQTGTDNDDSNDSSHEAMYDEGLQSTTNGHHTPKIPV
eukprot:739637_1